MLHQHATVGLMEIANAAWAGVADCNGGDLRHSEPPCDEGANAEPHPHRRLQQALKAKQAQLGRAYVRQAEPLRDAASTAKHASTRRRRR